MWKSVDFRGDNRQTTNKTDCFIPCTCAWDNNTMTMWFKGQVSSNKLEHGRLCRFVNRHACDRCPKILRITEHACTNSVYQAFSPTPSKALGGCWIVKGQGQIFSAVKGSSSKFVGLRSWPLLLVKVQGNSVTPWSYYCMEFHWIWLVQSVPYRLGYFHQ